MEVILEQPVFYRDEAQNAYAAIVERERCEGIERRRADGREELFQLAEALFGRAVATELVAIGRPDLLSRRLTHLLERR